MRRAYIFVGHGGRAHVLQPVLPLNRLPTAWLGVLYPGETESTADGNYCTTVTNYRPRIMKLATSRTLFYIFLSSRMHPTLKLFFFSPTLFHLFFPLLWHSLQTPSSQQPSWRPFCLCPSLLSMALLFRHWCISLLILALPPSISFLRADASFCFFFNFSRMPYRWRITFWLSNSLERILFLLLRKGGAEGSRKGRRKQKTAD